MNKLVRIFVILIATAMVANTAMACCLAGHKIAVAQGSQAEPCHDMLGAMQEMPSMEHEMPQQTADHCPGCEDCAPMLSQSASLNADYLLAPNADSKAIITAYLFVNQYDHPTLERQTGPPDQLDVGYTTPISLKQRLNL